MRPHRPVLLLALAALLTASCSAQQTPAAAPTASASPSAAPTESSPPAAAPSVTPSAAGATITISSFEYVVPTSVPAGAQVTVRNEDREAHTVTVDRGAVRLSVLPGETVVFTAPAEAGAHTLSCDFHGGMEAVLVVA